MKTSVQLIINELTEAKDAALNQAKLARFNNQDSSGADSIFMAYSIAIKIANKQLENEKKQIIEAFDHSEIMTGEFFQTHDNGEDYFNYIFK